MTILLSILAGAMAAPEPSANFIQTDMPSGLTSLTMNFFVDPEGRVLECEVERSNARVRDEEDFCADAIGKRLGKAAMGADGAATYGMASASKIIRSDRNARAAALEMPSDILVSVASMPGGARQQDVFLLAEIDENGAVRHCEQQYEADSAFAAVACEQAAAHTHEVKRSAQGAPVAYVDTLIVSFVRG